MNKFASSLAGILHSHAVDWGQNWLRTASFVVLAAFVWGLVGLLITNKQVGFETYWLWSLAAMVVVNAPILFISLPTPLRLFTVGGFLGRIEIHLPLCRGSSPIIKNVQSELVDATQYLHKLGASSFKMVSPLLSNLKIRDPLVSALNHQFKTLGLPWTATAGSTEAMPVNSFFYRLWFVAKEKVLFRTPVKTKKMTDSVGRLMWGCIHVTKSSHAQSP